MTCKKIICLFLSLVMSVVSCGAFAGNALASDTGGYVGNGVARNYKVTPFIAWPEGVMPTYSNSFYWCFYILDRETGKPLTDLKNKPLDIYHESTNVEHDRAYINIQFVNVDDNRPGVVQTESSTGKVCLKLGPDDGNGFAGFWIKVYVHEDKYSFYTNWLENNLHKLWCNFASGCWFDDTVYGSKTDNYIINKSTTAQGVPDVFLFQHNPAYQYDPDKDEWINTDEDKSLNSFAITGSKDLLIAGGAFVVFCLSVGFLIPTGFDRKRKKSV